MKAERIEFDRLDNTRDLGGLKTKYGTTIKQNKLIRSGRLSDASSKDKEKLAKLVDTIVDFRTEEEAYEKPSPQLVGVKLIRLEIMGNKSTGITREKGFQDSLIDLMRIPSVTYEFMKGMYSGFLTDSCLKAYRKFFKILLSKHDRGVLFHCTAGKDRTGFAAFLIEHALGVSKNDIDEDYMYTEICTKEKIDNLTKYYVEKIGENKEDVKKAVDYAFAPKKEYLDSLDEIIIKQFGNYETFFRKKIKLKQKKLTKLREMYLE